MVPPWARLRARGGGGGETGGGVGGWLWEMVLIAFVRRIEVRVGLVGVAVCVCSGDVGGDLGGGGAGGLFAGGGFATTWLCWSNWVWCGVWQDM